MEQIFLITKVLRWFRCEKEEKWKGQFWIPVWNDKLFEKGVKGLEKVQIWGGEYHKHQGVVSFSPAHFEAAVSNIQLLRNWYYIKNNQTENKGSVDNWLPFRRWENDPFRVADLSHLPVLQKPVLPQTWRITQNLTV